MKVLLIDDEPDILHHMKKALQILGHSCDIFEDPVAALGHLSKDHYDVVISDVVMPGMNGFAVATEVRRIVPEAKIILVSGLLTTAMKKTTGEFRSVVYMRKPIDVHTLKLVLDNIDRQLQAC
jgi:DNA-binding response OmpR family regulator